MKPPTLQSQRATQQALDWVEFWTEYLGITIPVRLERTSIWQVTDENGRPGCSLVGVVLDEAEACIYHTRRLIEEDVIHELLHVAHPDWSEQAVVDETAVLLPQSLYQQARPARSPQLKSRPTALRYGLAA